MYTSHGARLQLYDIDTTRRVPAYSTTWCMPATGLLDQSPARSPAAKLCQGLGLICFGSEECVRYSCIICVFRCSAEFKDDHVARDGLAAPRMLRSCAGRSTWASRQVVWRIGGEGAGIHRRRRWARWIWGREREAPISQTRRYSRWRVHACLQGGAGHSSHLP